MDEHNRSGHRTAFFKSVPEKKVVIILQSHSPEDNQVNFCLHCDSRKKLVIRLAGNGENRQFLRLDKSVEHINHRDTGPDHLAWYDSL